MHTALHWIVHDCACVADRGPSSGSVPRTSHARAHPLCLQGAADNAVRVNALITVQGAAGQATAEKAVQQSIVANVDAIRTSLSGWGVTGTRDVKVGKEALALAAGAGASRVGLWAVLSSVLLGLLGVAAAA